MRSFVLGLVASCALSVPAHAGNCSGDAGYVLQNPATAATGTQALFQIQVPAPSLVLFFVSAGSTVTQTPYGTLCVDLPALAVFDLLTDDNGEVYANCPVPCNNNFAGATFDFQALAFELANPRNFGLTNGTSITITSGDCAEYCPDTALDDQWARYNGDHAITLGCSVGDLVFVGGTEKFEEFSDGTARMTGMVQSVSDPDRQWLADISFDDRCDSGDSDYPPPGSPKLELQSAAYDPGGPVDPSTWHYYKTTTGTLTGLGDNRGCTVTVQNTGPAFQIGAGASGKNINFGGSGWLTAKLDCGGTVKSCSGDINIDLGICPQ